MSRIMSQLCRRKPIGQLVSEADTDDEAGESTDAKGAGGASLRRSMGVGQLTLIGISSVVGTGIFFVLGTTVPKAGPAVLLSFALAAVVAGLGALCYVELAGALPVSGSTYSYTYASLGEGAAYVVAWCLVLEYGVAVSTVAVSWGQYLNELTDALFGFQLPEAISQPPGAGGYFNLPALVVVLLCSLLLVRGTRESAAVNAVMVAVKLGVLVLFVAVAITAFNAEHFTDFAPHGMAGIGAAASGVFFSYVGFDTVATAGEEVRNPRRTIPLALTFTLIVVTLLYILVALAAVGAQPAGEFGKQAAAGEAVLAEILRQVTGMGWPAVVLSAGAVVSIFSVVLVTLFGQTRILFAMARDGLVPQIFRRVDRKRHTPAHNTWIVGVLVGLLAALVPLQHLADLTSMGTLAAFIAVAAAVVVLRRIAPDAPRSYRVPLFPFVPILSAASCLYLAYLLPGVTWTLFGAWLLLAAALYLAFGRRGSALNTPPAHGTAPAPDAENPSVTTRS
ncbi:amino acid permease [Streptomyces purpurogeneiscleroticus]|uniref:amino acid permease n=1 Tax=Streptomyces purpurogeneiscleroticus TaxID=68259 RepID=UPI001CBD19C7|nr:amino acid permease [Streptomyces purpurogeneiscleroticus]MBZ4016410.1 amino acid permease [Streptomyces purpurogeneiscleroticus]